MWLVVHFTKDNTVSAVPKSWWKHGYCAWPKRNLQNKNKLIESKQKPNKIDYEYFKARLMTENPIGNYVVLLKVTIKINVKLNCTVLSCSSFL